MVKKAFIQGKDWKFLALLQNFKFKQDLGLFTRRVQDYIVLYEEANDYGF